MIVDYASIDSRDRRLVIFAYDEMKKKLPEQIHWAEVGIGLPLGSFLQDPLLFLIPGVKWFALVYRFFRSFKRNPKILPYPVFDLIKARDQFRFPMNHPTDGGVYACCDAESDLYVPLTDFHRYMYQAKMSAFQHLCSNLGVKQCTVVYAEENGKDVSAKFGASEIPTQAGPASGKASGGYKKNTQETSSLFIELPCPTAPPIQTQTGWLNGEPTWNMMQSLRLQKGILHCQVEFNYRDEMGISADVAAEVSKIGLNIGGEYEKMQRRKWSFDVEFWPINSPA